MISCEILLERMPEVAHGHAVWTGEERSHLESCAACAVQWRLAQIAPGLGEQAARKLDVDLLARRVRHGVAADQRVRRWKRAGWFAGLAAAALVAAMVWGGWGSQSRDLATAGVTYSLPLAELEGLDARELQAVLETLDAPFGEGSTMEVPGLGGLDDGQLEQLLRSLEG